ncbi:MAG: 4Fe-4S binding protein, partial [Firmicutes bacterium]|nr:4Fe-4S binding protein [Bacillota bacterium]
LPERCIHCLLCWVFCPDMAVIVEDGRVVGFDYKHCKGCGICAKECPSKVHAIDMVPEAVSDTDRSAVNEYRGRGKSR